MAKYSNPEDITTGITPLKGVRNSDLYNQDSEEDLVQNYLKNIQRSQQSLWEVQTGRAGRQHIASPGFMEGVFTPEGEVGSEYGNSRFDKGLIVSPTEEDIANRRAENQTAFGQLLNGVSKGAVLAGTTFLDGTLGLAFGLVDAAQAGVQGDKEWYSRIWDNSVSNGLQQINQLSEEAMPNFRSAEEMNRSWYQNLGTMNFWADSFLKNIGFTVGAFYSGGAFNKLLKGAGLIKSGIGAAVTGSIFSAINEGRIEANNNTDDWQKLQEQQVNDYFTDRAQELAYTAESEEDYINKLSALDEQRQKALSDVQDNAAGVGLVDLLSNIAILSATNLLTYGRVYAKGYDTAKKEAARLGRRATVEAKRQAVDKALLESEGNNLAKRVAKEGARYGWKDLTVGKVLYDGARTALREGNEEMAQAMAAEFAGQIHTPDSPETYYRIGLDDVAKEQTDDLFDKLITSFVNTYGNGDRYEEFAVGALTGLLGMPTFGKTTNASADTYLGRNKTVGITGGLFGGLASRKELNAQGKAGVEKMNEFLDKFEQNKIPFYRRTSLSNAMDGWIKEDNKFEYKNAEDNDLFETIAQFSKMGKLSDLKSMIEEGFFNPTDELLESIATGFTDPEAEQKEGEHTGYRTIDGKLLSDTEEGRETMREILKSNGNRILEDIDSYEKALQNMRNTYGDASNESRINELAWMSWKLDKFNQRYKGLVNENREALSDFVSSVDTRLGVLDSEIEKKKEALKNSSEDTKESVQEELDALQLERDTLATAGEFSKKILGEDNIGKLLNSLPQSETGKYIADAYKAYLTLLQDGNIAMSQGFVASLDALSDVPPLIGAWNSFHKTLQDFIKNPHKVDEMHQKIDEEKTAVREERKKSDVVKKNKGKSAEELANMSEEDFSELDGLDNIPEDLAEAKREAEEIKKNAGAVATAARNKADQLSEEDSEALKDLINARTPSERAALLDPDVELSPDEFSGFDVQKELDDIAKQIAEEKSGILPTEEEIAEARLKLQEAKARKILDEIRASVDKGKAESATLSGGSTKAKTSSLPALTAEQKAEEEKFARILGEEFIKQGIQPEVREELFRSVVDFLERVRGWKLSNNPNMWALIHNDAQFIAINNATGVPSLDEAVVKDFLNSKIMFPESSSPQETKPVVPPAPQPRPATPNPSPSPSPSPASNPVDKPKFEEPVDINDVQSSEVYVSPYSREAMTTKEGNLNVENGMLADMDIPGYSQEQNAEIRARKEYLKSVGAFANRYNGIVYPSKDVHFEIRQDANNAVGKTVILIVDNNGNVLGDISPAWVPKLPTAMREWIKAKEAEYAAYVNKQRTENKPIETYRLSEGTKIKEVTPGAVPYISDGTIVTLNSILYVKGSDDKFKPSGIIVTTVDKVITDDEGKPVLILNGKDASFRQPKNPNSYAEGDIVLLVPTGNWSVESGRPEMEYAVTPVDNPKSVFRGQPNDLITRLFNKWVEVARKEKEESEKHTISNGTFAALSRVIDNLFRAAGGFHVNPEKVGALWHIKITRTTREFVASDNFDSDVLQKHEEKEGLKDVLMAAGLTDERAKEVINGILNAKTAKEARELLATVPEVSGTRLVYSNDKTPTVSVEENVFLGRLDDENFGKQLIGAFTGRRIQPRFSLLNGTFDTRFAGEVEYNRLIGTSIVANIAAGVGRTVNSYFTLEDFDMSKRESVPENTPQARKESPAPAPAVTAQENRPEFTEAQEQLSREDILRDLDKRLGDKGLMDVFNEYFLDIATDEDLTILNSRMDAALPQLRKALDNYDESDDAEDAWKDFMDKVRNMPQQRENPEVVENPQKAQESFEAKDVEVTIKDSQNRTQVYTVSGDTIRNKSGKEVFSKPSKQRNWIILQAQVKNGTAAIFDTHDVPYYVTYKGEIFDQDGAQLDASKNLRFLREALMGTPNSMYEGKNPFGSGVDLSLLEEAAYGWNSLSDAEAKVFMDENKIVGFQIAQRDWNNMSLRDRENALRCY